MKGYSYEIKAIPTMFQGVMMRSRLEARWAAFFTECGFPWTYEPIDFDGWSPDFSLDLHRKIYVEVKPTINQELIAELVRVAKPVSEATGARALLVGDSVQYNESERFFSLGVGFGEGCMSDGLDDIAIGVCSARACKVGMAPQYASYSCWVCNSYDGNPVEPDAEIQKLWAAACNKTQWKP
jgi:hypothetical protein